MLWRRGLIVMALIAFTGGSAQAQLDGYFPTWNSCAEMKLACQYYSASFIYSLAYLSSTHQSYLGTCYAHDDTECSNCACSQYVKLSYKPNPKGWDGGTGCMSSFSDAAAKLKELCEAGACCCPDVHVSCVVHTSVKARDPITGSCCIFSNPCSAPADWEVVSNDDPRCG